MCVVERSRNVRRIAGGRSSHENVVILDSFDIAPVHGIFDVI